MSLPVLPPIPDKAFPTFDAAPLIAGPAEEVTLERPCEALDCTLDVDCFAFSAISSVDCHRRVGCFLRRRVCRRAKRGVIAVDIGNEDLKKSIGHLEPLITTKHNLKDLKHNWLLLLLLGCRSFVRSDLNLKGWSFWRRRNNGQPPDWLRRSWHCFLVSDHSLPTPLSTSPPCDDNSLQLGAGAYIFCFTT